MPKYKEGDKVRLLGTYQGLPNFGEGHRDSNIKSLIGGKWKINQLVTITLEQDYGGKPEYWFDNDNHHGGFQACDLSPPTPTRFDILNKQLGGTK